MKKTKWAAGTLVAVLVIVAALAFYWRNLGKTLSRRKTDVTMNTADYAGTQSCRECHEKFYQLWAPSHHGLAMQPFTAELFRTKLTPQAGDLVIGGLSYRVEFDGKEGWIRESGPKDTAKYPIDHAMGEKTLLFLTSMDRGRLQSYPGVRCAEKILVRYGGKRNSPFSGY